MSNPRKLSGLLAAGVLFGILLWVHLYVSTQGLNYTGPLMFLDRLFDLAAVLALLSISTAVGHFALVRCGIASDRPLEAVLFGAAVGLGLVATSIFVLGILGGLQTSSLLVLLAVIAWLVRKQLRELGSLIPQGLRYLKEHGESGLPLATGTIVFCAVAIFMIVFAMSPPVDWDALMYHLEVPTRFLERGRIYLPEDNLHTAFVGLFHMLYLPLLAVGSDAGPALLNAILALLLGVAVFSFCARFLPGPTGSLTLAALWGTTTILLVAITPRLDVTVAFYLFLAHYALVAAALSSSFSRAHFLLAAVLPGFALGIKYHAAPYIVGLVPLIVWAVHSQTRSLQVTTRTLLAFGMLAFVAAFPWLAKNMWLFNAPLHPFFAPVTLEPWLVPFFGSQVLPPAVSPQIFEVLAQARSPFNLMDAFFAPHRITIEREGVFYRLSAALLLVPGWVFFARNKVLNCLVIPAVGYLLVLIVPFPETNLRYLIPAAVPLSIVAVYIAVQLAERILSRKAAHVLLVSLVALTLLSSANMARGWISGTQAVGYFVGASSANEYIADRLDLRTYAPVVRFINNELPDSSRTLMLYEARSFYMERPVIQDIRLSNWPLLAHRTGSDHCLQDTRITHVLLGAGVLGYYLSRGADPALLELEALETFRRQCVTPVYEVPGFILFEVNRSPTAKD